MLDAPPKETPMTRSIHSVQAHAWRAWRDTSTDGQPCVRVHGDLSLPDAGAAVELQRHGSAEGDAQHTAGELILDLVPRPAATDRDTGPRQASADYVLEETTGQVTSVKILQDGHEVAALTVEPGP